MLCSNNIIRYHRRSSKGFAGKQLINSRPARPPFFIFLMCGLVYTAYTVLASVGCCGAGEGLATVAARFCRPHLAAPRVSSETLFRSAASTALESEGCGCIH